VKDGRAAGYTRLTPALVYQQPTSALKRPVCGPGLGPSYPCRLGPFLRTSGVVTAAGTTLGRAARRAARQSKPRLLFVRNSSGNFAKFVAARRA